MLSTEKFNEAHIKKVAAVKCMRSLLWHTRYFFKVKQNRKFVIGDHHEIITEALERVLRGECKRLIINIAPRYGKTELVVKNFIAHALSLNPSAKFIHLSYSDSLALDNSEEVRDLIQSEEYQALFPHVRIKPNTNSKKKWYTEQGGGVYATSAAGQVTGFGAGRVDEEDNFNLNEFLNDIELKEGFGGAIIIDDPIKPEDADSDNIRDRVNNRFDSTIRNRVNSRNTPIIIDMQRLHPMDLPGYLQSVEPGEWEVISLPCIKEDGTSLWPFKHTIEELRKLEKLNPTVFGRQYMQNPKPKEGLLFPEEELNYYNPGTVDAAAMAEYRFSFVDPADEGGDDLCAPMCYLIGDKIYVIDTIYNNKGTDISEPACVDKILSHRLDKVEIEGNSAWILFAKSVRQKVNNVNENIDIRVIKSKTNKHARILSEAAFIKNNFVFRADWKELPEYRKMMNNLCSYLEKQQGSSKNKHDDAPDALSGVAKHFKSHFDLW
jgi:predicted phage terminase large subunit-like protein